MRRATVLAVVAVFLLGAALLVMGCGGSGDASGGASGAAPAFSGTRLDGSQVSLDSFRGKPLVLIFWASW